MASYRHNSTIRIRNKICSRCGLSKPIFSRGRCADCARIEDTLARMDEEGEDIIKEDGLQDLIKEADAIFSKWLRLSSSDKDGNCSCYTCDTVAHWTRLQCGHYIKRGNLFLRFDTRNCRVQCENCNIYLDGNYPQYTKRLEAERPGIVDYLLEESRLVYKPTREEIRNIKTEYLFKTKTIKNDRR